MIDHRRFTRFVALAVLSLALVISGSWTTGPAMARQTVATVEDSTTSIPYQGRLTGGDGLPVADGAYDFTFALYDTALGGTALWTETQSGVAVQDGYFGVLLGRETLLAGDIAASKRYLAVAVRGPGDTGFTALAPRQELVSPQASVQQPNCATSADHDHCGEEWSCSVSGLRVIGNDFALWGISNANNGAPGVWGQGLGANEGVGVFGEGSMYGVRGKTTSTGQSWVYGVEGETDSSADLAYGVAGFANAGSGKTRGVYGKTASSTDDAVGVRGEATASSGRTYGVVGYTSSSTQNSTGVRGVAASTTGDVKGVVGETYSTNGGVAVVGVSHGNRHAGYFETGNWTSVAVINNSAAWKTLFVVNNGGGPTGYFGGEVQVAGDLSSAGGSLKIDHPLDPENKYLNHSFVESPDRMNVYNGNAILDANGEAVVELPGYFEALNQEFRYQLTPIGAPAPNLYIAEEISDNRFKIAGGPPGIKVSWQVTGIRHDPWADANRIPVEETKPSEERGSYLHPELYGQPESSSIEWIYIPQEMRVLTEEGKAPASPD